MKKKSINIKRKVSVRVTIDEEGIQVYTSDYCKYKLIGITFLPVLLMYLETDDEILHTETGKDMFGMCLRSENTDKFKSWRLLLDTEL